MRHLRSARPPARIASLRLAAGCPAARHSAAGLRVAGLIAVAGAAIVVSSPASLAAQEASDEALRLGAVAFENSGASDAQEAFERGLLLLHSFEYGPAAEAFREAQSADPGFAMAYWGEAMTYNHPVWMRQDRDAAIEVLERYAATPEARAERAAREGSEREAAWMRAIDVLYGDGTEEKQARDDRYAEAMASIHERWPDDPDAAAFYALALLGTAHEGRDFATYMRSAGILERYVDDHPEHPGIAHYLIHSYDDPIHAPLGIRAARSYSGIAPDAAHAQHMTSHIFVALGLWDDVVAANENSMRVVNAERAARDQPPGACGHYNFWLEYGYLQQGRTDDARRLVRECYDRVLAAAGGDTPDPDNSPVGSYAQMAARYVIDAGDTAPLEWDIDLDDARWARMTAAFAAGWAAWRTGDADAIETALDEFRDAKLAVEAARTSPAGIPTRPQVLELELEALHRAARGEAEAAVDLARQAAGMEEEMPLEFGPPHVDKPSHELLGELLLRAGRAGEAREAFEAALARTPRRVQALEGLRSAEAEMARLARR